jgi:hypothetical protein
MTSTDMPATEGKPVYFLHFQKGSICTWGNKEVLVRLFFCFLILVLEQYCIYLLFMPNIQLNDD